MAGQKKKPQQNKKQNQKQKNGRRQYYLAAVLFLLILTFLFSGDIRRVVSTGADLAGAGSLFDWMDADDTHKTPSGGLSDMQVHYLDIGQGDATLITCDGHAMLVDAGNNNKGTQVQSYLQSQSITKLDYIIGTHPDADHIGGLDVIITKFPSDIIIMPEYEKDTKTYQEVIQAISYRNKKITYPKPGQTYSLGSAVFTILGPQKKYSNANDNSVSFLLEHGENRFLFTGDAEEEAESDMAAAGTDVSADVYKTAHHGSRTATTKAFFQDVDPAYAVISCGEGNSYGHPHAEVLNRLRAAGVQMYRTDDQGTIVATSTGSDITFNCSPSENWAAGE